MKLNGRVSSGRAVFVDTPRACGGLAEGKRVEMEEEELCCSDLKLEFLMSGKRE
jgi:hypothetical protein